MFDPFGWFKTQFPELPDFTNITKEQTWTSTPMEGNFGLEKFVVTATTDGHLKLDVNGMFTCTIPASCRHEFLEKIQKAVNMADIADPANEPLNKALT